MCMWCYWFCQIYPDGIRHIRSDKRVNEWKTPGKKTIVKCAVNQRQVVIALTGGELVYFELDPVGVILKLSFGMVSVGVTNYRGMLCFWLCIRYYKIICVFLFPVLCAQCINTLSQ